MARNSYEALRNIFMVFGECKGWKRAERMVSALQKESPSSFSEEESLKIFISTQAMGNKLISKLISIFSSQQSYYMPSASQGFSSINISAASAYSSIRHLIFKTR